MPLVNHESVEQVPRCIEVGSLWGFRKDTAMTRSIAGERYPCCHIMYDS